MKVVVERWQDSHAAVVGTWLADLPLAVVPLWQLAQPVVMPLWLNTAPEKVVVERWQVSHAAAVVTWLADLPVARL
ncbi:MAG TPA: hypothetical protein VG591_00770, partial [Burkholderiales bacterium]|nr:hypothetical protein [Burkholderiales bacterium]